MASLSIAKATLLASCLRRDDKLDPISRDELTEFHNLLERTISLCNNANIQKTKLWLVKHILPSTSRTQALNKYFATLSKNIQSLNIESTTSRPCRRQLHLTYLLHDLLHHAQYHPEEPAVRRHAQEHIPPVLAQIFSAAASEKKPRTMKRLQDLVDIWQKEHLCRKEVLEELRHILASDAPTQPKSEEREDVKITSKELPWIMPATHGDPRAPYFDLPAANLMPHIVPNSSRPIRTDQVKALHLTPGPADETLINALKDFLKDVNSIDDPYNTLEDEGIVPDIDEMGQITYTNEVNDPVSDTYYGWSKAFCEKMKSRSKDDRSSGRDRSLSRSRSYSRSRSRSRSPINGQGQHGKRKRYSRSRSSSESKSHDRSHTRPTSDTPPRRYDQQLNPPVRSFPPAMLSQFRPSEPTRPQFPLSGLPPPPPPPPMSFEGQPFPMPLTHQAPPRPPNWPANIPWPPPPPPPPSHNVNFNAYGKR